MKRYVQRLSPEARREWRRWQAWWICFYTVIVVALVATGFLAPGSDETGQARSLPTNQGPVAAQPGISARVGLK
jgi:hypothetical protein